MADRFGAIGSPSAPAVPFFADECRLPEQSVYRGLVFATIEGQLHTQRAIGF